jgi:hypothetical protein
LKGIVEVANNLVLGSLPVSKSWYESNWMGSFFFDGGPWIYHIPLGWMYVYPAQNDSYWFWNQQFGVWLWTNDKLFPQAYSGSGLKWLYFHIKEENVRVFDYHLQRWDFEK